MDLSKMKQIQQEIAIPQKSQKEFAVSKDIKGNGVNNLFRIVDSDNFAKCSRSWIVCDDGTIRPFTLIDSYGNKSPLLKLLGDPDDYYKGGILESVRDEITKKAVYKYNNTYPEWITRLGYNGDRVSIKGSAKLQKQVVYQIIDRDLYEGVDASGEKIKYYWCKENNHTMLLWLKPTAFDTLIVTVEGNGDPVEYDCAYIKSGSGQSTTHIIQKAGPLLPGVVVGELTAEELAYERYDLDQEAGLSPAGLILYYLPKLIKDLDIILGYNVYEELEEMAKMERSNQISSEEIEGSSEYEAVEEEDAINAPSQTSTAQPTPVAQPTPMVQVVPEVQAAPTVGATPRRMAAPKPAVATVICLHKNCGKEVPADAETCPYCKNPLLVPCDNPECGKLTSVFATVCPHCNYKYDV